jgi:hypothetical protein
MTVLLYRRLMTYVVVVCWGPMTGQRDYQLHGCPCRFCGLMRGWRLKFKRLGSCISGSLLSYAQPTASQSSHLNSMSGAACAMKS